MSHSRRCLGSIIRHQPDPAWRCTGLASPSAHQHWQFPTLQVIDICLLPFCSSRTPFLSFLFLMPFPRPSHVLVTIFLSICLTAFTSGQTLPPLHYRCLYLELNTHFSFWCATPSQTYLPPIDLGHRNLSSDAVSFVTQSCTCRRSRLHHTTPLRLLPTNAHRLWRDFPLAPPPKRSARPPICAHCLL